jgi:hypothetical protein
MPCHQHASWLLNSTLQQDASGAHAHLRSVTQCPLITRHYAGLHWLAVLVKATIKEWQQAIDYLQVKPQVLAMELPSNSHDSWKAARQQLYRLQQLHDSSRYTATTT